MQFLHFSQVKTAKSVSGHASFESSLAGSIQIVDFQIEMSASVLSDNVITGFCTEVPLGKVFEQQNAY